MCWLGNTRSPEPPALPRPQHCDPDHTANRGMPARSQGQGQGQQARRHPGRGSVVRVQSARSAFLLSRDWHSCDQQFCEARLKMRLLT